jgi:hypothetical protein
MKSGIQATTRIVELVGKALRESNDEPLVEAEKIFAEWAAHRACPRWTAYRWHKETRAALRELLGAATVACQKCEEYDYQVERREALNK